MAGDKGNGSYCFIGTEFLLWMVKKFWKCIVVMTAQQCEYYLMPLNYTF